MSYEMTKKGYEALKRKLQRLETEELQKVQQKVEAARAFCDFSEDPMYQAFVDESTDVRDEIQSLKHQLKRAIIVEEVTPTEVTIGVRVTLVEKGEEEQEQYVLVSPLEANIDEGLISTESPLGRAMLGKKEGEEVHLEMNETSLIFVIERIERF